MSALGAPLAVYTALAYCDTRHEHEVRLITDGARGYAYGTRYGATDSPTISRDDTGTIRVDCGQVVRHAADRGEDPEPCTGQVTFTLSTPDWISRDTEEGAEALDLLEQYGERIER